MTTVLLLSAALTPSSEVLPALALLPHTVRVATPEPAALLDASAGGMRFDAILIDARRDLVNIRGVCRMLRATGLAVPLIAVFAEGGLIALSSEWAVDDVVLDTAGPAELDARLRLAIGRCAGEAAESGLGAGVVHVGDVVIDEHAYIARVDGHPLDLTFKEFELLKYLAQHPGRVFSRAQLLQEVWGYDYYGGTRTVDVHVRRLRAKLGPEHEAVIGTVRNVGYKFVRDAAPAAEGVTTSL